MRAEVTEWLPLFDTALEHPTPRCALGVLARGLLASGVTRSDVLEIFDDVHAVLEANNRHDDEDAVLDLLDQLTGWTNPELAI